jgi:hypothetical protein
LRQLDGLADVGEALGMGKPISDLWRMRNGYAMCERAGLEAISEHLAKLSSEEIEALRGKLAIGEQTDGEVTDIRRTGPSRFAGLLLGPAGRLYPRTVASVAAIRLPRPRSSRRRASSADGGRVV